MSFVDDSSIRGDRHLASLAEQRNAVSRNHDRHVRLGGCARGIYNCNVGECEWFLIAEWLFLSNAYYWPNKDK